MLLDNGYQVIYRAFSQPPCISQSISSLFRSHIIRQVKGFILRKCHIVLQQGINLRKVIHFDNLLATVLLICRINDLIIGVLQENVKAQIFISKAKIQGHYCLMSLDFCFTNADYRCYLEPAVSVF